MAAFGTGAAAGALGAPTGGASFAAAGGAAMGGGGFLAGFAGGGIGTLFGSTVQNMGNTAFFNDPYPTVGEQLLTVGVGALSGGLINGASALAYGRNFWNGNVSLNLSYPNISITGNIQQQTAKASNGQLPKAKIDGLLDDGLPKQGPLRFAPTTGDGIRAGYNSHSSLVRALGRAGDNKQWHHIVGQFRSNIDKFGAESIHNVKNVVAIPKGIHYKITGLYNSINPQWTGVTNMTVKQWVSSQTYQQQYNFGVKVLNYFMGW